MKRLIYPMLALACFIAHAEGPSDYETKVTAIARLTNGDFVLTFQKMTGNKVETIRVADNDGIATLAATQLAFVDAIKSNLKPGIKPTTDLADFMPAESSRLLTVQRDALELLILQLEGVNNKSGRLRGTSTSVEEALKLLKPVRDRFSAKLPWTVADIEKMGKAIESVRDGGGPYQASSALGSAPAKSIPAVSVRDTKNPSASLLNGQLSSGFLLPSQWMKSGGVSKSHVYVNSDNIVDLAKEYEKSRKLIEGPRIKSVPGGRNHGDR